MGLCGRVVVYNVEKSKLLRKTEQFKTYNEGTKVYLVLQQNNLLSKTDYSTLLEDLVTTNG